MTKDAHRRVDTRKRERHLYGELRDHWVLQSLRIEPILDVNLETHAQGVDGN
jgi:hypothetical protein